MQKIQEQVMNALKVNGEISNDEKITEYAFKVFSEWNRVFLIFLQLQKNPYKQQGENSKNIEEE